MKRYLTCLLLLFFSLGLNQKLSAQPQLQILGDSLMGLISPNNVALNDTVTYAFNVENIGNVDFSDTLIINARVGSNTFVLADLGVQFIPVFGSEPFTVIDTVTLARYDGGVNVVVIWPTSPHISGDSTMDSLTVQLVGIKDGSKNFLNIQAFPNPTNGDIYLRSNSAANITKTSIISLNGQVLQSGEGLSSPLQMSELAQGLYFVKIETDSGQQLMIRVQKR